MGVKGLASDDDHVSRLQVACQRRQWAIPEYADRGTTGHDHERTHTVRVTFGPADEPARFSYLGTGSSKKVARRAAALAALRDPRTPVYDGGSGSQLASSPASQVAPLPAAAPSARPTSAPPAGRAGAAGRGAAQRTPVQQLLELGAQQGLSVELIPWAPPAHSPMPRVFGVDALINGVLIAQGCGASEQRARHAAAEHALSCLADEPVDDPLAVAIVRLAVDAYTALARKGVRTPAHTCVASIVQEVPAGLRLPPRLAAGTADVGGVRVIQRADGMPISLRPVAVAVGTGFVTEQMRVPDEDVVLDAHAEVLARRALRRYLVDEMHSCARGEPSVLELSATAAAEPPRQRFALKPGVRFHLYVSSCPCGDGEIYPLEQRFKRPCRRLTCNWHAAPGGAMLGLQEDPVPFELHWPAGSDAASRRKTHGVLRVRLDTGESLTPVPPTIGPTALAELVRDLTVEEKELRARALAARARARAEAADPAAVSVPAATAPAEPRAASGADDGVMAAADDACMPAADGAPAPAARARIAKRSAAELTSTADPADDKEAAAGGRGSEPPPGADRAAGPLGDADTPTARALAEAEALAAQASARLAAARAAEHSACVQLSAVLPRARKLSCCDKLLRWNVCGVQGGALAHLLAHPVFLASVVTGGPTFSHGALSRALCCRARGIEALLPWPHALNHPSLAWVPESTVPGQVLPPGRPGASKGSASTLAWVWAAGDEMAEVLEAKAGRPVSPLRPIELLRASAGHSLDGVAPAALTSALFETCAANGWPEPGVRARVLPETQRADVWARVPDSPRALPHAVHAIRCLRPRRGPRAAAQSCRRRRALAPTTTRSSRSPRRSRRPPWAACASRAHPRVTSSSRVTRPRVR